MAEIADMIEYRVTGKPELEHLVTAMDELFKSFSLRFDGPLVVKRRGINDKEIEVIPEGDFPHCAIYDITRKEEANLKKAYITASTPEVVRISIGDTYYNVHYLPKKK